MKRNQLQNQNNPHRCNRFLSILLALTTGNLSAAAPASVKLTVKSDGSHVFTQASREFILKGAGGQKHLDVLKECGGNAIRTWGIESLEESVDGKPLVKRAAELGIGIVAGIWIAHERHGFNYSDAAQVQKQRDTVRAAVRKWRENPTIIVWGLGNEMEGPISDGSDARIWRELEVLRGIIREEDPGRPVMTAIAGAQPTKIKAIIEHYPSLDILGVNAYASASGVPGTLVSCNWKKPFMLTEFGPMGHWEVPKASWGAPREPSSRDKAASYFVTYTNAMEKGAGQCVGTFAFLWGNKQETTSTWYGMFLPSGEKLPAVDAISRAWNGTWPANRCPRVNTFSSDIAENQIAPGASFDVRLEVVDPEGDPLVLDWSIAPESTDTRVGGDREKAPPAKTVKPTSVGSGVFRFKAPSKQGPYRLFLIVRDGKGAASAENFTFMVKP